MTTQLKDYLNPACERTDSLESPVDSLNQQLRKGSNVSLTTTTALPTKQTKHSKNQQMNCLSAGAKKEDPTSMKT